MSDLDEVKKAMMESIGSRIASKAVKLAPVDQGHLRSCIGYKWDGTELIVGTGPEAGQKEVPYAEYVEYGTPGQLKAPAGMGLKPDRKMPMFKEGDKWFTYVDDWARFHGIKNAFALAKHIQLYGTEPHPFLRPAMLQVLAEENR